MKKSIIKIATLTIVTISILSSCKKKDEPSPFAGRIVYSTQGTELIEFNAEFPNATTAIVSGNKIFKLNKISDSLMRSDTLNDQIIEVTPFAGDYENKRSLDYKRWNVKNSSYFYTSVLRRMQ